MVPASSPSTDTGMTRWRTRPAARTRARCRWPPTARCRGCPGAGSTTTSCCSRMVSTERTVSTASKAAAIRDEPPDEELLAGLGAAQRAQGADADAHHRVGGRVAGAGHRSGPPGSWAARGSGRPAGRRRRPDRRSSISSVSSMDCFWTAPSASTTTSRASRGPGPPAGPTGWRPSRGTARPPWPCSRSGRPAAPRCARASARSRRGHGRRTGGPAGARPGRANRDRPRWSTKNR